MAAESQHHHVHPDFSMMAIDFVESDTFKPFIIPIAGLIVGAVMLAVPKIKGGKKDENLDTLGRLVVYFGSQSFMNIFMGWLFRTNITVPKGYVLPGGNVLDADLHGCPVGFALTALQQVISFFCFIILYGALYFTPHRITPKKITSVGELVSICIFGCVFALNIALNNFSLGYISVAVNLIIRSCLPLSTLVSSQALSVFGLYKAKPCKIVELALMIVGVICAASFTAAKIAGSSSSGHSSSNMILGVVMCIASLLCGSLNLALAGALGEMKLSVYDTVAYMSVPATVFLLPFVLFLQKPVPGEWPQVFGVDTATDWQIIQKVAVIAPKTFGLFALSGVFSFMYNIVQFSIVHALSPSATAFGGNFNKAALVFLTLLLPFLQVHALPGPPYIIVIWVSVIGNVLAFSAYSYLQILEKEKAAGAAKVGADDNKALMSEQEVEEWSSGSESSDDGAAC
eukprot:gb/GFBE01076570.1/.p1 GENE.gb/GFBE01076570.1/~~gb/GFBE01076570.1/.p1  ORF type:complete len:457 (+),score=116.46 gb/GFBE01076570.1/:1-1371(+)